MHLDVYIFLALNFQVGGMLFRRQTVSTLIGQLYVPYCQDPRLIYCP